MGKIVQKQFSVDARMIFDNVMGKNPMATNGLIRESIRAIAEQVVVVGNVACEFEHPLIAGDYGPRTWITVTYDVEEVE